MADYEVPKLNGEGVIEIPKIKPDAMAGKGPYIAKPDFQKPLHFPTDFAAEEGGGYTLVPDWKEKALAKMDDLRHRYRSLQLYLDICVKCGAVPINAITTLAHTTRKICQWRAKT